MNGSRLIDAYRRNGVVRCHGLLDPAEVIELRAAFETYQSRALAELPEADYTLEPDQLSVRNFWRMQDHDPFFRAFAERPVLVDLVEPLVNGAPVLVGVETFNKPARVGSPVPPHQDNAYFCQTPPDVLTVWIALDPATAENGAVEYSLGSQHEYLPHAASGVKGNSFGLADESVVDRFPQFLGTVDPGDALIHHCQTIHRSQPNRSAHSRLSLVIVYRGGHTVSDQTMQVAYQDALATAPQNA